MSDEELIAELRQEMLGYRSPQWAHLRRLVLAAADALTRSQSRVEELEQALRNLLDTIERGDGYRAFERTAAARDALTNSEQGRDSKGDCTHGNRTWDNDLLLSNPPRRRWRCPDCGATGTVTHSKGEQG